MTLALRLTLALWSGLLVVSAALVAPLLFALAPSRELAGFLAGHLFTRVTWLSVAGALIVLGCTPRRVMGRLSGPLSVLAPALLLLANEYLLRPVLSAARIADGGAPGARFLAWHAVSTALYATATLIVLVLWVREERRASA